MEPLVWTNDLSDGESTYLPHGESLRRRTYYAAEDKLFFVTAYRTGKDGKFAAVVLNAALKTRAILRFGKNFPEVREFFESRPIVAGTANLKEELVQLWDEIEIYRRTRQKRKEINE